jgi:hypothetical protein
LRGAAATLMLRLPGRDGVPAYPSTRNAFNLLFAPPPLATAQSIRGRVKNQRTCHGDDFAE